jgi:ribosomal protein S18 acetylase RimI-like enzyme
MVRAATVNDAETIAMLMLLAMKELVAKFRNDPDSLKSEELLTRFIRTTGNQYSYTNVLVFEAAGEVIGSITAYDGAAIEKLRQPFLDYLIANYHPSGFELELETTAGEFYIDVIGVAPNHQGKGIGKKLIEAAIAHAAALGHQKVGLLVDVANPRARKLYESIGFKKAGQRLLLGSKHDHMLFDRL